MTLATARTALARGALLVLLALIALQLYFLLRVVLMIWVDPDSTSFQRSEMHRLLTQKEQAAWSRHRVGYEQIGSPLKRAVIAAEDTGFVEHSGVEWDALEKAWERNQAATARVDETQKRLEAAAVRRGLAPPTTAAAARVVGGSTITQQLAKNLFLGPERSLARKAQEVVIVWMLEACLSKRRILEIYLNNVEWRRRLRCRGGGAALFPPQRECAHAAAGRAARGDAAGAQALRAAARIGLRDEPRRDHRRTHAGGHHALTADRGF